MNIESSKHERFKRLAKLRGERILKDIQLLANLSNRNNYEYSEEEMRVLFSAIDTELRYAKSQFATRRKKVIRF